MRRLFLKIFLWFWGAMILIGLTLFLLVTTAQPDPLPEPWRESTAAVLAAYAATAADAWEQGGRSKLNSALEDAESHSRSRLLLFDTGERELSGRRRFSGRRGWRPEPPPGAPPGESTPGESAPEESVRGEQPRPAPPREPLPEESPHGEPGPPPASDDRRGRGRGGPPWAPPQQTVWERLLPWEVQREPLRPEMLPAVRRRALQSEDPIFVMSGPRVLAVQRVKSPSGKSYVLQALLPRPRFGRPAAEPGRQLLGVVIVLAMSGLVCYGLVRYLTAPLVSLRAATHQLAAGDLAARTGAAQRARRDEVADLGRDFDAMAERIETLVLAQRRLLGDISHELRSPLSRLSMALALGRRYVEQSAPEAEINGALDRIKREAGRLNALIEQLLQLARLESGEVQVENVPLDLEQLVHDIVTDADFEARASNRTVRVTRSEACHITGSADLLRSAVENVVRNAVRYTAPGTAVEVSLNCCQEGHDTRTRHAVIRVRDHGEGVPEEALQQLFRPFYRVGDARDRESGGVGLGLAITQRAIVSCGGSVQAQNATDGGLLVEIQLPLPSSA